MSFRDFIFDKNVLLLGPASYMQESEINPNFDDYDTIIKLNKMNVLENFYEKVKENHGDLASGACMIFSNESLSIIKRDLAYAKDISLDIIPNFLKKIYVYEHESAYLDIGSPETLEYANKNLCNGSVK